MRTLAGIGNKTYGILLAVLLVLLFAAIVYGFIFGGLSNYIFGSQNYDMCGPFWGDIGQ